MQKYAPFCPLIGDDCKKEECLLWKNGGCLLPPFIKNIISIETVEEISPEEVPTMEKEIKETPDDIKNKTAEELAKELVEFIESKEDYLDERTKYWSFHLFWEMKGVEKDANYATDIQMKINKAELLAQYILDKNQLEKERELLSSFVNTCFKWAKENGLNRVTQSDIESFLIENNMKLIMPESKKMLVVWTNFKLKHEVI